MRVRRNFGVSHGTRRNLWTTIMTAMEAGGHIADLHRIVLLDAIRAVARQDADDPGRRSTGWGRRPSRGWQADVTPREITAADRARDT